MDDELEGKFPCPSFPNRTNLPRQVVLQKLEEAQNLLTCFWLRQLLRSCRT